MSDTVTLKPVCPICSATNSVTVSAVAFKAWQSGVFAQVAFPELEAEIREMLITGICPPCWEDMFGDNDETSEDHMKHWM